MSSTRAQVALRSAASMALLVGGLVHLQLYFLGYRSFPDPNLGRSFLLNVAASAVIAALIALRGGRALEISGIVVAASTLVFFTVTRSSDALFGFRETGLSPSPQAIIAIVAEVAAIALLAASLATSWSRERVHLAPRLTVIGTAVIAVVVVGLGGVWADSYGDSGTATVQPASTTVAAPSSTAPPTTISAAGGGTPAPAPAPAASTTTLVAQAAGSEVHIVDFSFVESTLAVPVGTTVRWVNDDQFDHSIVAADESFDSGELGKGDQFDQTFAQPGTYAYICGIHPYMSGTIEVTG